jgi:hypothetical protein
MRTMRELFEAVEMPTEQDVEEAFGVLEAQLKKYKLETKSGRLRTADPDEFQLMDMTDVYWRFKHSPTRNYLYVERNTKRHNIVVPNEGKPFFMGYFDA